MKRDAPRSKNKKRWLLLAVPALVLVVMARALNTNPPTSRAATSPNAPDAALRTRVYNAPIEDVETATRQGVLELRSWGKSWTLPFTGRADETMTSRIVDVEVPVLIFVDDMTVKIQAQGRQTRVDIESKSRVGNGDFGENRRHVLQLLAALDARLKRVD